MTNNPSGTVPLHATVLLKCKYKVIWELLCCNCRRVTVPARFADKAFLNPLNRILENASSLLQDCIQINTNVHRGQMWSVIERFFGIVVCDQMAPIKILCTRVAHTHVHTHTHIHLRTHTQTHIQARWFWTAEGDTFGQATSAASLKMTKTRRVGKGGKQERGLYRGKERGRRVSNGLRSPSLR